MTKEEAKEILKEKHSELKQAEIMIETHENGIREIKEHIEKLKAFINKKDDWRLIEVPDSWQALYEEKALLMADMLYFAHVKNEGWLPDWEDDGVFKWGIAFSGEDGAYADWQFISNEFAFGIAVKSQEIAREMLEEFGERIEAVYNKQYYKKD